MKRGGKVTRVPEAILAEQKVLKAYKLQVDQAFQESTEALAAQIAGIKAKRNEALERIREGERHDEEAKGKKDKKD